MKAPGIKVEVLSYMVNALSPEKDKGKQRGKRKHNYILYFCAYENCRNWQVATNWNVT